METEKPVLVIRTDDLEKTRLFYEALGLTLVEERHAGCPTHYSCDFGGLLLEFYPAGEKGGPVKPGNDLRLFFETERFDLVLDVCRTLDLERGPVSFPDAKTRLRLVTLRDPDGRVVRLREAGKTKAPH